ncbi:sensor histidine kinase [Streptomyces griseus]|uniref:sensor histidine kinase n=1 Tax=Streptomyces griseus TaxID=1911 RepID=UPI00099DDDA2|nr:sensor histidine kinase [Streptomyces griseus]
MSTHWQSRAATRPRTAEAVTLALPFAAALCGVFLTRVVMADPPAVWSGLVLSAGACAALRRRHSLPLPVFAVILLGTMVEGALGYLMTPLLMAPLLVAQYVVSACEPRRRMTWYSAVGAAAGVVVTALAGTTGHESVILIIVNPAAWVLLSAACGSYIRVRREYAAASAEHAAREREEEARHRVIQERMRIARELHDVVAHHMTLADAQASTAAHLARTHPEQALGIIGKLPEATAAALRELKATVGLLREDSDGGDLAPAPGLRQLPDLVDACSVAGLEATVTVEGRSRRLTPVLDLTAYRIIQEALTNVTKHAATRTARVRLSYTPRYLTLTISNDTAPGRPSPASGPGGGFGLLSMRERATAVGGTFHAGHRPQGTFEVACTLPLDGNDDGSDGSEGSDDTDHDGLDVHPDESPAT